MPEYTYRCDNCGKEVTVLRYFTDDQLQARSIVHDCGGYLTERVYRVPGITIKGTGKDNLDRRAK